MPLNKGSISRPQVRRDAESLRSGSVGRKNEQHLKPTNEKLWHMLTVQARAKFVKYPSPSASSWVHKKYVLMGGKFVDTAAESKREKVRKAVEKSSEKTHHRKHKK